MAPVERQGEIAATQVYGSGAIVDGIRLTLYEIVEHSDGHTIRNWLDAPTAQPKMLLVQMVAEICQGFRDQHEIRHAP